MLLQPGTSLQGHQVGTRRSTAAQIYGAHEISVDVEDNNRQRSTKQQDFLSVDIAGGMKMILSLPWLKSAKPMMTRSTARSRSRTVPRNRCSCHSRRCPSFRGGNMGDLQYRRCATVCCTMEGPGRGWRQLGCGGHGGGSDPTGGRCRLARRSGESSTNANAKNSRRNQNPASCRYNSSWSSDATIVRHWWGVVSCHLNSCQEFF